MLCICKNVICPHVCIAEQSEMLLCLPYAGDISLVSARCSSIHFTLITSMAGEQKPTLPICVYLSFSLIHLPAWQLELQSLYCQWHVVRLQGSCLMSKLYGLTWCSVAK